MTSEQARGQPDVLDRLNRQVPTSFYWYLTLLATIGGFLFGYDTANIGSTLDFIPYPLSDFALGYLVAGASVGAAVGAFFAGSLTDRFGRKTLLIADALIYAIGAILSAVSWDATVLLFARTLIGLAIGADSAIATAYIAEYAPSRRRGSLVILQQWMITIGIFSAYLVALVIFLVLPDYVYQLDWRLVLGLGAVPALIALVLRARMPESPRWLMRQGRFEDVRKALGVLGIDASTKDIEQSASYLESKEQEKRRQQISRWTPGVRRALVVVMAFFVFQQITGINVPLYYGPHLLGPYFQIGDATKLDSAIAAIEATLIISAVNAAATYFAFRWIDRLGRRKLSIGGYTGMAVSMLLSAVGIAFFTGLPRVVIVMIGLDAFIASFAIGVGGTGWLIQGEVFPTAIRGRAAALGATADWLANFALIQVFPVWQGGIGLAWVLVCFAVLALLAIAFIVAFLPETKELSVEEITEVFEESARRRTQWASRAG
jgi:MFS transporter, SP family, arabinose:H+ symporter